PASRAGSPPPASPASIAATSCSVKNGFPSARAYNSPATRGGGGPPHSPATCSAASTSDSGASRISSTPHPPRTCASQLATSGSTGASSLRHVTTSVTASPHPARERKVSKSSVALSAQCTSST